jgi:hypothetical protein
MDKPAEAVNSLDAADALIPALGQVRDRYLEVDPAVRALAVVVLDELPEHPVEVAFAPDEQPVQALGSCGADEAFGDRVRLRRPDGCLDDPGPGRAHHLVEGPDELGVPVADQGAEGSALVLEGRYEVPGLLRYPGPNRVGSHTGQEDLCDGPSR